MLRALAIWIIILNTSTITLTDTMLVADNEVIEVGDIRSGESCRVEIDRADSVRVVFLRGEDWIGTDMLPRRDTIEISDETTTFEVEIL